MSRPRSGLAPFQLDAPADPPWTSTTVGLVGAALSRLPSAVEAEGGKDAKTAAPAQPCRHGGASSDVAMV
ncbi:hypothetical protein AB0C59_02115 [Streptomyces sp. NPDC048664]|uniref:hypothetical protein n=1 Tax=Streptomyces sp. NPDC048664 TaxID=3154505 RepID=UPI0034191FDA